MKVHNFSILIEKDENGYYIATVPALKSCYTQAKTLEELYPRIKEVIELFRRRVRSGIHGIRRCAGNWSYSVSPRMPAITGMILQKVSQIRKARQ